jgi:2-polyprenyl-6-methoxyphenol hydroxylase-like FAD-dependent oxidoreductase
MSQLGRILVVGGGIGGLSVAAASRKLGLDVTVFEQAREIREVGAGVGLWSNAMASLDELEVGGLVRRGCIPIRTVCGSNARGKTLSKFDLAELGPDFEGAACYVVLRAHLLAALATRVPADSIVTASRVLRVDASEQGVRVHFEDGRTEVGDLVVGADGIHSVVRPTVVGPDATRYSGQTCFRGIARIAPPEPGILREVQGRGQRASVCPVDENTVYWWTAFNAPPNEIVPVGERKQRLTAIYSKWPFGIRDAIEATPEESILQNDLIDRAPVRTYVRGRTALVGDAAHPTTPNLGQGANMAIDDVIVLARALRSQASVPAALERYQRERLKRTRLVVQRSWNFGRMMRWDSPIGVAIREWMMRSTPASTMRSMLRWQILEGVGKLSET